MLYFWKVEREAPAMKDLKLFQSALKYWKTVQHFGLTSILTQTSEWSEESKEGITVSSILFFIQFFAWYIHQASLDEFRTQKGTFFEIESFMLYTET